MNLDPGDCELFFKLHKALMLFVNQRLKVVKPPAKSVKVILPLPPEDRLKVRDAFLKHLDLIDAFVEENPFKLDPEELDTVRSWHDLVAGEFYVFRHLKKYTVFLTAKEPTVAYGVVALSDPFEEVIDQELPFLCKTVLLPFQGRIVYDGLLSGYNLIIGSNIRRELNDAYNDFKKRHGIVTSLPWRAETPRALPKRGTARKKRGKRGRGLIGQLADHLDGSLGPRLRGRRGRGVLRVRPGRDRRVPVRVRARRDRLSRGQSGMASLPSSSPGTATTRWTPPRGGAGRSSTGMRSKGGSSSIGVTTLPSGRSGRGVEA